jgi:hypothetical protein
MQGRFSLRKLAAVVSSALLIAWFVAYQAGAFNTLLPPRAGPGGSESSPTGNDRLDESSNRSVVLPGTPPPTLKLTGRFNGKFATGQLDGKLDPTIMGGSKSGAIVLVPPPAPAEQPATTAPPSPPKAPSSVPTIMGGSKTGYIRMPRILP